MVRPFTPGPAIFTYWDYTQLAFQKRRGMRIDFILGSPALAERVAHAEIVRDERKGSSPATTPRYWWTSPTHGTASDTPAGLAATASSGSSSRVGAVSDAVSVGFRYHRTHVRFVVRRQFLAVVEDAHRQESMQMARKLAALAQLLGRRIEEELAVEADIASVITGFARTTAEVSAAMNMTAARARVLVAQAESLDCRLPAVAALLAAGVVDWYTVEIIIARTDFVDDDKCALVDARLAEQISDWCCWSRQRIINAVDYAVNTLDAEAAKRRRAVAFDQRGVTVTAGLDGMARARISMTARAGAVFDTRLSELAKAVCTSDPRTLQQRRVDALEALLDGQVLACACENPDCPSRAAQPPRHP